jgi:hypothetical protein
VEARNPRFFLLNLMEYIRPPKTELVLKPYSFAVFPFFLALPKIVVICIVDSPYNYEKGVTAN